MLVREKLENCMFSNSERNVIDYILKQGAIKKMTTKEIAELKTESIQDTLSLITHDDLQKAVQMIKKSSSIHLFAVSNNLLISQEFKHNMSRINKEVHIHGPQNEIFFNAALARKDSCAIIISYSGESGALKKVMHTLKDKNRPTIVITSIGDNTLSKETDCLLHICTREKLYYKNCDLFY